MKLRKLHTKRIPAPLTRPREEAEEVADGVDACNKKGVVQGLKQAEAQKTLGNQAIKQKQRNDAVKHYSNAVECLQDAWSQRPTDNQAKEIKNLMSVCLCNRAAAWLMDGAGQDAKRALKDADEAIERDPSYNKALVFDHQYPSRESLRFTSDTIVLRKRISFYQRPLRQ